MPRTIYRVGGVVLQRESIFCHYKNQVIIKMCIRDSHTIVFADQPLSDGSDTTAKDFRRICRR